MIGPLLSLAKTFKAVLFENDAFQCTLSIGRNLEFKVLECPGKWCSDEELGTLRSEMHAMAIAGQAGKPVPDYGVLRGTREDFANKIISIAYDKTTGRPVGFSAQSYLDIKTGYRETKVLHLGLIFVDPELRGRNLTHILSVLPNIIIFLKTGMRPVWVSNVSQVPAIIGLVGDNFANVYPVPGSSARQSFDHRWLASEIMKHHREVFGVGTDAEFDLEHQIIRNAYTGGSDNLKKTFSEAPKHRNENYNLMCQRELCYERGDDFIQLGRMTLKCYLDWARKKLEGTVSRRLIFDLAFMGLLGVIVPAMRWLVPDTVQMREGQI